MTGSQPTVLSRNKHNNQRRSRAGESSRRVSSPPITHQHHPFVSVVRDLLGQYTIIGGVAGGLNGPGENR